MKSPRDGTDHPRLPRDRASQKNARSIQSLHRISSKHTPSPRSFIAAENKRHEIGIIRDRPTFNLTRLGEFVAERFLELREAMEIEGKLRDVWEWLRREMDGFSVDLFADAVVSYPGPGYPYEPIERLTHLIENTTQMRGFDSIVFKSINNEAVCRAVIDGMEVEYVYSPTALEKT